MTFARPVCAAVAAAHLDSGRRASRLAGRGWVEPAGSGEFRLSEEGRRRHAAVLVTQKQVRQQAMQGISQDEYVTAVRVLQRLVENLEGEGESGRT